MRASVPRRWSAKSARVIALGRGVSGGFGDLFPVLESSLSGLP